MTVILSTAVVLMLAIAPVACGDESTTVRAGDATDTATATDTTTSEPAKFLPIASDTWFNYRDDDSEAQEYPVVVATTTIWAALAWAHATCAGSFDLAWIVPASTSSHDYSPSPNDLTVMTNADAIIAGGHESSDDLRSAIATAEEAGVPVFRILDHVSDPLPSVDGQGNSVDPHVWLDPVRTAEGFTPLLDWLGELIGPALYTTPEECSEVMSSFFDGYDHDARTEIEQVPVADRIVVTTSDALGYFADRYGLTIIRLDLDGNPSARSLIETVAADRRELLAAHLDGDSPVVFIDAEDADLTTAQLAEFDDSGGLEITALHLEALGRSLIPPEVYVDDGEVYLPQDYGELIYQLGDLLRADLTGTESIVRGWITSG